MLVIYVNNKKYCIHVHPVTRDVQPPALRKRSLDVVLRSTMSTHADRSEYQPLRSSEDDTDEHDQPGSSHHVRRHGLRPGSIDLTKLDNAFKRLVPEFYIG